MIIGCLAEGPGGFINSLVNKRNQFYQQFTTENKGNYIFDEYFAITL